MKCLILLILLTGCFMKPAETKKETIEFDICDKSTLSWVNVGIRVDSKHNICLLEIGSSATIIPCEVAKKCLP